MKLHNADCAHYAKDVLKGPFPAGEEAISKDAEVARDYAKYIVKTNLLNGKILVFYSKERAQGPFLFA